MKKLLAYQVFLKKAQSDLRASLRYLEDEEI